MKNRRHKSFLAIAPVLVLFLSLPALFGCQATAAEPGVPPLPQAQVVDPPSGAAMLSANTYAGDAIANILLKRMSSGRSILTASMVNMDKLDQSSTFGRVAMQQVGSRVSQHGFRVIDVRLTEAMIINNNGEFMLSRDVCKILASQHDAYAVLVGVYTPAGNKMYVSVRALRLSDAAVIAAYEYYLPLNGEALELLSSGGGYSHGGSGDASWNRYAARGQAFPNCPPQTAGVSQAAPKPKVAAAAPAAKPKSTAAKKPVRKKRTTAARSAPRPSAPAPQQVVYRQADPECPQNVPSNRRTTPIDDCYRGAPAYAPSPTVYGEVYVDRGGGRIVNPNTPPPAVGRSY